MRGLCDKLKIRATLLPVVPILLHGIRFQGLGLLTILFLAGQVLAV
jgi:hypothetical protein